MSTRSARRSRAPVSTAMPRVAVCLLFSYLNPEHELRVREAINARHPDVPVSLSHEVAPIWREYERGTTVTVDAFTKPLFDDYVDSVSRALADAGVAGTWSLLKSNGGRALASEARSRPAHLLLSGIAGGGIGGAYAARAAGVASALAFDMGGTSCDVCLVQDGEPLYSSDFELEFGFPVSVPSVSTRTIGAGGGSIGWVDPGGFLQVGPAERRRLSRPGLLRPGRGGGHDHRRQPRARPPRPGLLPRRSHAARPVARARGARRPRQPAGTERDRHGLGDGAGLQREHGQRHPHPHRRAGYGPTRPRVGRVRRRRADARLRDRGRARHYAGARAACPRPLLRLRRPRRRRQNRRRPQRLPHRRAHDPGRGGGHLRGARGAGTRGFHCPGSRGAADRAPPRRHALPGAELRAGGAVPGRHDRRGGPARGLRGVRAALRGLLRLPAGRDPDRARPAGRDRDGRAARVRAPARDRRAVRGGDTRARRLLPAAGLRADADRRTATRSRPGAELAGPAIVEFMDSTVVVPPDWTLRAREDGILEVAR